MEIDAKELAQVLSTAITQTLVNLENTKKLIGEPLMKIKRGKQPIDKEDDVVETIGHHVPFPTTKKRGRPAKAKKENSVIQVGDLEESIDSVLNFEPPIHPNKKHAYIATAKRVDGNSPVKNLATAQDIRDPNRKIKFIDDPSVGDNISSDKYPERSDRRPPAQLGYFKCSGCGKDFEGSYKEYGQALIKTKDPLTGIEDSPTTIKCPKCSTR
jgi:hypothetical protein